MDFNDLKFNPEFKEDYVLTLNNGIGHKENLACYCEKHRCFVTKKQIKSGNRHCFDKKVEGFDHCIYCVVITPDNFEELKAKSALEEKLKEY